MTAHFAWVVNRLAQVVPQLYYGPKPTKGAHGSDPVRILACYELTPEDYEACKGKEKSGLSYTLDILSERYPAPQLEEVT